MHKLNTAGFENWKTSFVLAGNKSSNFNLYTMKVKVFKYSKLYSIILASFCCWSFSYLGIKSEDAFYEYLNLSKKYFNAYSLDAQFDIVTTVEDHPQENETIKNCIVLKSGFNQYLKLADTEVVNVKPYSVIIDHNEKSLLVKPFEKPSNTYEFLPKPEEANKYKTFITPLKVNGTNKAISIKIKSYPIYQYDLHYASDYTLKKVVIYSEELSEVNDDMIKSKAEINYKKAETFDNPISSANLNWKNFFEIEQKKIKPAERFKNYQIINLINS